MLYRQKFDTFIRSYSDIGYIINKGNFTDQVTDRVGSVFLRSISREPKDLKDIINEISNCFGVSDTKDIENDVVEFFCNLERDGFIVSGNSISELNKKDNTFSYKSINDETTTKNFIMRTDISTQSFLDNYLKNHPKLISFQIEITSKCNERCIHCYIPHENKDTNISSKLFYKTLKQCEEMGVMDITLSGGEPMAHPNFLEFLKEAKRKDFYVTVLSNLTLINDEIISELKSTCLSGVQVSLYSMDSKVHDSITHVPGSFEKTKQAILKLIENDIPVQISCPTMLQNKNSYRSVAKWANAHGIRAYTDCILMARYDHTTDNLNNRITLDDMKNVFNDIIECDLSYQDLIKNTDFKLSLQNKKDDIICSVGIMSMCMVSNGNTYPCAGWQSYICGNLMEKSLEEIWNNSPELNFLRKLRKKDLTDCLNCSNQQFCAVCMVRNANEDPNGNPLKINKQFCKIAELNKEVILKWQEKLLSK